MFRISELPRSALSSPNFILNGHLDHVANISPWANFPMYGIFLLAALTSYVKLLQHEKNERGLDRRLLEDDFWGGSASIDALGWSSFLVKLFPTLEEHHAWNGI